MSSVLNENGSLAITAMSLVELLPEVEQAVHNGFMLKVDSNEGYPQMFGTMFVVTMYPAGEVTIKPVGVPEEDEGFQALNQETTEDQPKKRGPKPRG
jgi:hypothetical protein